MKVLYTAVATATGDGRNGHVETSDGLLVADVRHPVELGGEGGATNPEQLFAAGYAVCFHSAIHTVARRLKIETRDSSVTARVGFGTIGGGAFGLTVTLDIALPSLPKDQAEQLIAKAHERCPYSNATRGNIDVELNLVESS
ncbi:putative organic hydroperoxide resistance protein/OsmC-like protein [Virgisporangium aliadipatigenens]|uniref:Putative organic hydroperoxide resistance protein/OsmC-like protein n=1 Tax=Virgisporangium aliadipatigenens TaxID=741659 RepID=A0A8J4DVH7_9ACTN|nr:organic hydroperoxide resistance protein [Virgisporangium aliadipatigenens]GIJ51193.1 putative organic hydroperoxide resistance protein/OsmC-like protein [Virgisporangium aliadipatigenens]